MVVMVLMVSVVWWRLADWNPDKGKYFFKRYPISRVFVQSRRSLSRRDSNEL